MIIAGKRITFHPGGADRPGRNVIGELPKTLTPDKNAGVLSKPLPVRGNDTPQSAPSSKRIIDGQIHAASHIAALPGYPTPLDTGLPPTRIRRLTRAIDHGAVQKGTGTGITGPLGFNYDTDGGSLTIPHIRIPRTPITVTAFRRTVDSTSSIPARGIGAPVR